MKPWKRMHARYWQRVRYRKKLLANPAAHGMWGPALRAIFTCLNDDWPKPGPYSHSLHVARAREARAGIRVEVHHYGDRWMVGFDEPRRLYQR